MRRVVVTSLILLSLLAAGAVVFKLQVERMARNAARQFAEPALEKQSTEEIALEITRLVHKQYRATLHSNDLPLLFKLRPFLTHRMIPDAVRIENGAIEALLIDGDCDSAARATAYVLESAGIPARQFNLIDPAGGGHSIVQASNPDGSTFLLDPQIGVAPRDGQDVLDFEEARRRQAAGVDARALWRPVTEEPRFHSLYENFESMWGSPQGAALEIAVRIDFKDRERLQIGEVDQSSKEVGERGAEHELTVYWSYLGHRYDRGWIRAMTFEQPTRATFMTVGDVASNVITSDRMPTKLSGSMLQYDMDAGDTLRFYDDRAQIDWLRLKSYQDVDAILFERRN